MQTPIIIDTDPGMDDALAILFALRSPALDVRALTVVAGNVGAAQGTVNARKILRVADRCDVPVVTGAAKPLLRELGHGWPGHGPDGLGGFDDLTPCETPIPNPSPALQGRGALTAVRFLIETLLAAPEPITLVPIAPLTNIALALAAAPEIKSHIKELIIMGGAVFCAGNSTPTAEFNIWIDPEAARIVFASGVPITLVGLDVTLQTIVRESHVARMAAAGNPQAAFAARIARYVMPHAVARYGEPRMHLHDPLAVGVALDRSLVRTRKLSVDVETANGLTVGQTVAHVHNQWGKAANVDVCVEVDGERFVDTFVQRLVAEG